MRTFVKPEPRPLSEVERMELCDLAAKEGVDPVVAVEMLNRFGRQDGVSAWTWFERLLEMDRLGIGATE